jgi:CheY-like chemotaxis protein
MKDIPLDHPGASDRRDGAVVFLVGDTADRWAVLRDVLDESGYSVVLIPVGDVLQRVAQDLPDIVLLHSTVSGPEALELARRLRLDVATDRIPIIYLAAATEQQHGAPDTNADGLDWVPHPTKHRELLARIEFHLARAGLQKHTDRPVRNALDAFGYAGVTVRVCDGRMAWQTPLARQLLQTYFGGQGLPQPCAPEAVQVWLRRHALGTAPEALAALVQHDPPCLTVGHGSKRLTFRMHQQVGDSEGGGDWLVVMTEVVNTTASIQDPG